MSPCPRRRDACVLGALACLRMISTGLSESRVCSPVRRPPSERAVLNARMGAYGLLTGLAVAIWTFVKTQAMLPIASGRAVSLGTDGRREAPGGSIGGLGQSRPGQSARPVPAPAGPASRFRRASDGRPSPRALNAAIRPTVEERFGTERLPDPDRRRRDVAARTRLRRTSLAKGAEYSDRQLREAEWFGTELLRRRLDVAAKARVGRTSLAEGPDCGHRRFNGVPFGTECLRAGVGQSLCGVAKVIRDTHGAREAPNVGRLARSRGSRPSPARLIQEAPPEAPCAVISPTACLQQDQPVRRKGRAASVDLPPARARWLAKPRTDAPCPTADRRAGRSAKDPRRS